MGQGQEDSGNGGESQLYLDILECIDGRSVAKTLRRIVWHP